MKTGRLPPDYSKPRLWAEDYYNLAKLPVPPPCVDRMSRVATWPMYLNDKYGCCTIAGFGHLFGAITTYAKGGEITFSDADITTVYEDNCPGFNPVTDANDNGAVMSNVLAYMASTGMLPGSRPTLADQYKISAYAQLKNTSLASLKLALYLFGSVYIGVNLPTTAEEQFSAGQPWTYVQGAGIAGGHCVVIQKIDPRYQNPYSVITWGSPERVSEKWMDTYLEEAWVVVSSEWLQTNLHTIDGLDISALEHDMNAI